MTLWIEPESWIPDTEIYLVFKGGMDAMDRTGELDTGYGNGIIERVVSIFYNYTILHLCNYLKYLRLS